MNGSIGTVREIVWSADDKPGSLPELVVVEFDDYRGPCFPKWKDDKTKVKWVPLGPQRIRVDSKTPENERT